MSNQKTIILKSNGTEQTFGFAHALRIMRYEKSKGKVNWSIVTKGYEFKDNEIIRSSRSVRESAKPTTDS